MHYLHKKYPVNSSTDREISANLSENYRRYNFQAFASISANFRKMTGNVKFPENLQPYSYDSWRTSVWLCGVCQGKGVMTTYWLHGASPTPQCEEEQSWRRQSEMLNQEVKAQRPSPISLTNRDTAPNHNPVLQSQCSRFRKIPNWELMCSLNGAFKCILQTFSQGIHVGVH